MLQSDKSCRFAPITPLWALVIVTETVRPRPGVREEEEEADQRQRAWDLGGKAGAHSIPGEDTSA